MRVFWEIIKEDFTQIIKKRLTESIERFNLLKELFDKITISVILDWAHVAMEEKELVHMANKKDIPIFFFATWNNDTKFIIRKISTINASITIK